MLTYRYLKKYLHKHTQAHAYITHIYILRTKTYMHNEIQNQTDNTHRMTKTYRNTYVHTQTHIYICTLTQTKQYAWTHIIKHIRSDTETYTHTDGGKKLHIYTQTHIERNIHIHLLIERDT